MSKDSRELLPYFKPLPLPEQQINLDLYSVLFIAFLDEAVATIPKERFFLSFTWQEWQNSRHTTSCPIFHSAYKVKIAFLSLALTCIAFLLLLLFFGWAMYYVPYPDEGSISGFWSWVVWALLVLATIRLALAFFRKALNPYLLVERGSPLPEPSTPAPKCDPNDKLKRFLKEPNPKNEQ